jgi:hypothetical protein
MRPTEFPRQVGRNNINFTERHHSLWLDQHALRALV